MANKLDLSNAAYSPEYKSRRNKIINNVYNQKYKTGEEVFEDNNLKKIIEYYLLEGDFHTKENDYCAHIKIYSKDNELLHEYFNIAGPAYYSAAGVPPKSELKSIRSR